MATGKRIRKQEPGELAMLLPWFATGSLSARDSCRTEEALTRNQEFAKQYAAIRKERAEIVHLNESLGAPSARAERKLFAEIDGEPRERPRCNHLVAKKTWQKR